MTGYDKARAHLREWNQAGGAGRGATWLKAGGTGVIYTIGHAKNYREAIRLQGEIFKVGKGDEYPGGYAFLTQEDAQRRIDEEYPTRGFVVFGLKTDWANTYPAVDGWWHYLESDAKVIELEAAA